MARKKKMTLSDARNEVEWGGYIDLRLSPEQKDAFLLWREATANEADVMLLELICGGMKYSLAYTPRGDFWTASFTMVFPRGDGTSIRYCLTARAPNREDVDALLVYKHDVVLRGDWSNYDTTTDHEWNFG